MDGKETITRSSGPFEASRILVRAQAADAAKPRPARSTGVVGEIAADGAKLPLGRLGGGDGGGQIVGSRGRRRRLLLDQRVKISLEFKLEIFAESGLSLFLGLAGDALFELGCLLVHGQVGVRVVAEVVRLQRLQLLPLAALARRFVQLSRAIRIVFYPRRLAQVRPRRLRHFHNSIAGFLF